MKMVFVPIALVFLVLCALGEACERHGAKCPDFTFVRRTEEYEERQYPPLVWVTTSANGAGKYNVSREMYDNLTDYISGGNTKAKFFEIMVPIRTTKTVHEDYNTYTMAFLVPSDPPPTPRNSKLQLVKEPATTYYIRGFPGYLLNDSSWEKEADKLRAALLEDGMKAHDIFHMAAYDSPWHTTRRNEIWMEKKSEPTVVELLN